jgi:regulator of protease activity HflC (stomatin/prohibitin superfamily)/membrane protein implicated in regulation of membrane protease activity
LLYVERAMVAWIVWLIVAAVLGVAELVTFTFALGLIAVAACVAAAIAALQLGLPFQLLAFVIASVAGLGIVLPVARRHVKQPPLLKTGPAALVGRSARVLEEVNGHGGRVRIGGEEWSARSYDESMVIPVGQSVDVMQIEGATALVYPRELPMVYAEIIIAAVVALIVLLTVVRSIRIIPQARARNVERFGRYRKTLEPGLNFIVPFVDRVKTQIDLREQVVSFNGQPVITEDNLVVQIDTVLFFQVTDPKAADYEIVNYIQAIEQLTATMLRSVIGSMDLEQTLTSRDKINTLLRGVLDDASGKWGIRVTRVEIKAIDPPKSVKDAMEKQMRAEREKRAAILNAEGQRQSQILTAEGDRQSKILRAQGDKQAAILRAEGEAQAINQVFESIHRNDPDPKLLAYQYLQTLPQLAAGAGNTFWVIPSEVTTALKAVTQAFGGAAPAEPLTAAPSTPAPGTVPDVVEPAETREAVERAEAEALEAVAEAEAPPVPRQPGAPEIAAQQQPEPTDAEQTIPASVTPPGSPNGSARSWEAPASGENG